MFSSPALSQESPRKAIEQQYRKSVEAVKLRYLPGCLSVRHPEFQAFAPDGTAASIPQEQRRLQYLLVTSIFLDEKSELLSFRKISDDQVECVVKDTLQFAAPGATLRNSQLVTLNTRSQDLWVKTRRGWRLRRTRVLKQESEVKDFSPQNVDATATPTPTSGTR